MLRAFIDKAYGGTLPRLPRVVFSSIVLAAGEDMFMLAFDRPETPRVQLDFEKFCGLRRQC
jgi:hypothetical protein